MKVPFFRYPHVFRQQAEAIHKAILDVAERGAFIMQDEVRRFEQHLATFCDVKHAVSVANATDGLEIAIRAAGIGPGDEVLLPSHTFIASASAVVTNGAKPVFVEAGRDHLMDPDDLAKHLTSNTRAVMPTQLNGRTVCMDEIQRFVKEHGLTLLEDSAQGLGSRYQGRMAGTFGSAGVYSFYPAKVLGCLGDGGAIVTNDDTFAETVAEIRDHGRNPTSGDTMRWGRNSRLDNLQAAVLLEKFALFEAEISTRRRLALRYHRGLEGLQQLLLPPPPEDGHHFDTFQNYEIESDDRDGLRSYLAEKGVGTILQWGGLAVHEFAALGIQQSLPRTERIMRRSLLLPMNSSLSDSEVDYVCEIIRTFHGA